MFVSREITHPTPKANINNQKVNSNSTAQHGEYDVAWSGSAGNNMKGSAANDKMTAFSNTKKIFTKTK